MKKISLVIIVIGIAFSLISCAGGVKQQKGTAIGTGVGAGIGAVVGQAIGGDTEATLIGAGIGAIVGGIAGNQVGLYMDRQEQELRMAVAASEAATISRTRQASLDVLTATFKSEVLFDFDSATLKQGAYTEISRVADVLNRYPQTTIRVEGHTDSTGPESYNQKLSELRAQAVKYALVQNGVDERRVTAIGFGESQPVSSNDALNRRVNIIIVPIVQPQG